MEVAKEKNVLGIIVRNLEESSYERMVTVCICASMTLIQARFLCRYTERHLRKLSITERVTFYIVWDRELLERRGY